MFKIFKEALRIDSKNKEGDEKSMRSSMLNGKILIGIDMAEQTSWKSLGCAPSMREVCKKCEGSGT